MLSPDQCGCPYLFLAPMEGVGDRSFRKAMASIGGFNEAVTEFLRVPSNAHVESLSRRYNASELAPTPLAAQLMGADPDLMAAMAIEIEKRGAPRIDLNCGCPSNTVTGRGAGSSLLKDPKLLNQIAAAMVKAVSVPVTVKMRSGFEDTSLFKENLAAAQDSGIAFLTLHPRTKVDGYGPPAKWDLIAEAKSFLKIPVVGNGDILSTQNALDMLRHTRCDALMIGRGSVTDPFIFRRIRSHFARIPPKIEWSDLINYFQVFISEFPVDMSQRMRTNKLKQLMSFIFKGSPRLLERRQSILSVPFSDHDEYLAFVTPILRETWAASE